MANSLGRFGGLVRGITDGAFDNTANTNAGATELLKDMVTDVNYHESNLVRSMLFGELAGVTSNTVAMATDIADSSFLRLSFTQDSINGPELDAKGALWVKYLHNNYDIDGMSSSFGNLESSNSYDGVTVGLDLAKYNNMQFGIALSYVEGDGDGYGVENDYDMWGATIYGNINNEIYNFMADISYSVGDNELKGNVNGKSLTADRDLSVLSIGTRFERLFKFDNTQLVLCWITLHECQC